MGFVLIFLIIYTYEKATVVLRSTETIGKAHSLCGSECVRLFKDIKQSLSFFFFFFLPFAYNKAEQFWKPTKTTKLKKLKSVTVYNFEF